MTLLQLVYMNHRQGCPNKNINTLLYPQEYLDLVKKCFMVTLDKIALNSCPTLRLQDSGKNTSSQAPVFALPGLSIPRTTSLFQGLTLVFFFFQFNANDPISTILINNI